ncbi:sugar phosphate isomerase/epimerase [Caldibacillus lycopersici]|uniref:Sugar phosphate isomerase/epimerase n=1 Tax=Perspicuibacillus lycopersici TaxID=1325689 RepID=A0AAE3IRJ7_9BACI|nr:sugar phosphate isomerase/epimerase family protein [Perspicuibacillus lycopersici]MCU9613283.1 sugar phosphate isomerase/epimerase [Perspicuibacillus lycopersici]
MNKKPRISVFPKGLMEELIDGRMSVFEWIMLAGTLHADGLEMYPAFLKETSDTYLTQVKKAAEAESLLIPMMCSSPDFTHPDEAYRAKEIEKMKVMIDVMAFLGPSDFRSCRVLSGQRRPGVSDADGVFWTVGAIKELLPYAASKQVHLVMENHYKDGQWVFPEFAQKSSLFLQIIQQIDSPWFGVNFDPSNAIFAGENPLVLLEQVKNQLITMHASDRYVKDGYSLADIGEHSEIGYSEALAHGVIGKGMNDYDAIFETLRSINFSGWISIEDGVNGLDELKESVEFLKAKVEQFFP